MTEWRALVDGRDARTDLRANATLAEALRACGVLEVKIGCDSGTCGCCTVRVDGVRLLACITVAMRHLDAEIETAATFADGPVAEEIAAAGGSQCGYCTPGFVVAVNDLASDPGVPATPEGLREALDGNLCRCTGYDQLLHGAARGLSKLRGGTS